MRKSAGFTIAELLITLTIMVTLITLATVNLMSGLAEARDHERQTDVENIIIFQEYQYTRNEGWYLPTGSAGVVGNQAQTKTNIEAWYFNMDRSNLRAPGIKDPDYSLMAATNATQTTSGVLPQPTKDQYIYQPLTKTNALCVIPGPPDECRKFNIYYLRESDGTVVMMSSKNQ